MKHGFCYASQQKIADEVGISRNTVNKKIQLLIDHGYLEELPSQKGWTKKYRPTGTAELENECYIPVEEPFTPGENSHRGVTKVDNPVTKSYNPVTEVYTKKEYKETIKENNRRREEDILSSVNPQESDLYHAPEIQLYIKITDIIPTPRDLPTIIKVIQENDFNTNALKPFWDGWMEKNYNPNSLTWLTEWAVTGRIGNEQTTSNGYDPNQYITGPYSEFIEH